MKVSVVCIIGVTAALARARAIAHAALGILIGILVGAIVAPGSSFLFGLLGFILAGVWLWIASRRAERDQQTVAI
jgi:hypothetical protein